MNRYLTETSEAFSLVSNIVQRNNTAITKEQKILVEVKQFVEHDFMEFMKEDSPPNSAQLFRSFIYELHRFEEFVTFPYLAEKQIIGLGGAFSSGKSSFLNKLFGRKLLPTHIDPTTSVPTYLLYGEEESIGAINTFNKLVELDEAGLKAISHDFQEEYGMSFGHLLKSICIGLPDNVYHNLAFLDTPGYSKPDVQDYNERTDENIAREQLNTSHSIIWFMNAEAGTFKEEDINFLSSIERDIPIFIIVSRADKVEKENMEKIVSLVKQIGEDKGLYIVDVIPFSSRKPSLYPIEAITKHLEKYNRKTTKALFARNFKAIFTRYHAYYDEEMSLEKKRLNRLNKMMLAGEFVSEVKENLRSLQDEIKLNIKKLQKQEKTLQELRQTFFAKIKEIGDLVGIPLPEPSDIDLIEDKLPSSLDIIRAYKKEKGLTEETDYVHRIAQVFQGTSLTVKNDLYVMNQTLSEILTKQVKLSGVEGKLKQLTTVLNEKKENSNCNSGKASTKSTEFSSIISKNIVLQDDRKASVQSLMNIFKEHVVPSDSRERGRDV